MEKQEGLRYFLIGSFCIGILEASKQEVRHPRGAYVAFSSCSWVELELERNVGKLLVINQVLTILGSSL